MRSQAAMFVKLVKGYIAPRPLAVTAAIARITTAMRAMREPKTKAVQISA